MAEKTLPKSVVLTNINNLNICGLNFYGGSVSFSVYDVKEHKSVHRALDKKSVVIACSEEKVEGVIKKGVEWIKEGDYKGFNCKVGTRRFKERYRLNGLDSKHTNGELMQNAFAVIVAELLGNEKDKCENKMLLFTDRPCTMNDAEEAEEYEACLNAAIEKAALAYEENEADYALFKGLYDYKCLHGELPVVKVSEKAGENSADELAYEAYVALVGCRMRAVDNATELMLKQVFLNPGLISEIVKAFTEKEKQNAMDAIIEWAQKEEPCLQEWYDAYFEKEFDQKAVIKDVLAAWWNNKNVEERINTRWKMYMGRLFPGIKPEVDFEKVAAEIASAISKEKLPRPKANINFYFNHSLFVGGDYATKKRGDDLRQPRNKYSFVLALNNNQANIESFITKWYTAWITDNENKYWVSEKEEKPLVVDGSVYNEEEATENAGKRKFGTMSIMWKIIGAMKVSIEAQIREKAESLLRTEVNMGE